MSLTLSDLNALLTHVKRLHFIGIGGSGMFPIVQILHAMGYQITGSDNNTGAIVDALDKMHIPVTIGQKAENIAGAELIVYTAAILPDNPELLAAKNSRIPMVERAMVLGWLTARFDQCVCVSGTHGKTTVTAMLTQILLGAGADPSCVIGGKLPAIDGYGRLGASSVMTCEACEFQDHFLLLAPDISLILNIDNDHMEYFQTMDRVRQSYRTFAENTSHTLIINGDDENVALALRDLKKEHIITFGWKDHNDYRPTQWYQENGVSSSFTLLHRDVPLGRFTLHTPGRHNVLNASAALAAAFHLGVSPEDAKTHLVQFHGAGRRFEVLGRLPSGATVADDYAHHPAEIAATLKAAKSLPFQRVWAVFQPFTYSRTKLLMDDFAKALSIADLVLLSEIMGGREKNTDNLSSAQLAEKIPHSRYLPTFPEIAAYVRQQARKDDLILTMGCGDVYKCARLMLRSDAS